MSEVDYKKLYEELLDMIDDAGFQLMALIKARKAMLAQMKQRTPPANQG